MKRLPPANFGPIFKSRLLSVGFFFLFYTETKKWRYQDRGEGMGGDSFDCNGILGF